MHTKRVIILYTTEKDGNTIAGSRKTDSESEMSKEV